MILLTCALVILADITSASSCSGCSDALAGKVTAGSGPPAPRSFGRGDSGVRLSSGHRVSARCGSARYHVDVLFDGALRARRKFFVLPKVLAEVPSTNKLLDLPFQLATLLSVMPILPVETMVLHRVGIFK